LARVKRKVHIIVKKTLERIKSIQKIAKWIKICLVEHKTLLNYMWDYHLLNNIYKVISPSRRVDEKNISIYLWKLAKISPN
jgi:hypothetical protein